MRENALFEQKALKISMLGTILFVALGFGFAFLTGSDSILFDGFYSLISFAIAILTLKVAKIVEKPDDDTFHFGYSQFEPLINVSKSLFILAACVFGLYSGVNSIISGGNPMAVGQAVIYGLLSTSGCYLVGFYLNHMAKKIKSGLLKVDAMEWLIDGTISFGILIGFGIAYLLQYYGQDNLIPFVDPVLLIVISVISLPFPIKVILSNLREIVFMAPPDTIVDEIEKLLDNATQHIPLDDYEFRVLKQGRNTFILVHLIVSKHFHFESVADLDKIRDQIYDPLVGFNPEITPHILFIKDRSWADL
jgi:cation diffusion facilitator family transporter